ncbi:MAG TPA: glycosyltransferase family A protein, partial [Planctomycetaceae bacterium]
AVAERYAAADRRVRVVRNERNLGDYPNRNRAATLARGEYIKYHDSDDVLYPHCLEVLVSLLASTPAADFALSVGRNWPGGPCPMLLTPRMCYQREFLGAGMFSAGPSCALFRTEAFRRLGGFPPFGVASDGVFWLRACARCHVVLAPGDLFWYRTHPGQELHSDRAAGDYARAIGERWRALNDPSCPLTEDERELAKQNAAAGILKLTARDLRRGRWRPMMTRLRHAGLGPLDWLRYARRPRRELFAGTPRDADGDYVIPAWVRPAAVPSDDSDPADGSALREGVAGGV